MFYIPQIQKDDCGFACLKMLLATINKDKNYLFLPQDENHGYYSYSDLLKIGKRNGAILSPIKVTEKETIGNNKSFPLIVTICPKMNIHHAILVTKIKWKRVYYLDPKVGQTSMSLKKFLPIWDGTGLIVESFEKRKCDCVNLEPLSMTNKIVLGAVQLIAGALAVIGVYFIKEGTPIYIPAIFLSAAIVVELLMRIISYNLMKKLDAFFFEEDRMPQNGFRRYVERFENYKRLSLSSPMNYVLLLIFCLGLLAVVLLNDIKNAMLIIVPLVLALLDLFIVNPYLHKKRDEVNEAESEIDSLNDVSEVKRQMKEVHTKAYNFSYTQVAINYIYAGLIILTTLLTMHICGLSSFPYIIFYSCLSITFYRSIHQLISFGDRIEEYNIAKVKLSNSLRKQQENK